MHTTLCLMILTVVVDAVDSGNGQLDILINDGSVPCQVEPNGARKFLATFVPETAMTHVVRILFNNVEVSGWQHYIYITLQPWASPP